MRWTDQIDIEDLLEDDLQLVYEHCGKDVLLALLDKLKGMHIYLNAKPVTEMKKRYIRNFAGERTVKELAARLECTPKFVYNTLNEDEGREDDVPAADLFSEQRD